jgi:hypothetical protein
MIAALSRSNDSRTTAGILLLTIVAVEFGGVTMLRIVRDRTASSCSSTPAPSPSPRAYSRSASDCSPHSTSSELPVRDDRVTPRSLLRASGIALAIVAAVGVQLRRRIPRIAASGRLGRLGRVSVVATGRRRGARGAGKDPA